MFETAELGRKLSKAEYEAREPLLRMRLLAVQQQLAQAGFPVFILVSGVDGAGKGETVNLLNEWMDPRYLSTFAFGEASDEERERPPFWRYWRTLTPAGRIGIYFGSWYTNPIIDRVHGRISQAALDGQMPAIRAFEQTLVDEGALLIKLWFHITEKQQRKRIRALVKDKRTRWRVTKTDIEHLALYGRFRSVSERVLRETSTGGAPWTVIEAEDAQYRAIAVGEHLLSVVEKRIAEAMAARTARAQKKALPALAPAHAERTAPRASQEAVAVDDSQPLAVRTILSTLDLTPTADSKNYDEDLESMQARLHKAWQKTTTEGRSAVLVFEGWDAAGKGGAIRRITPVIDARSFQIIPIAAPTDEEKAHHYLWRFWRHLPRAGRLTIFDRSWYGRVLVERVEGFCTEEAWNRAYAEINDFEEQLNDHGIAVVKLWLHIDRDEQLRRFQEREQIDFKKYKITRDDYRNREKWDAYELAVNDMVERTSTEYAPWELVPANDKRYARLEVLRRVCVGLERANKEARKRSK